MVEGQVNAHTIVSTLPYSGKFGRRKFSYKWPESLQKKFRIFIFEYACQMPCPLASH